MVLKWSLVRKLCGQECSLHKMERNIHNYNHNYNRISYLNRRGGHVEDMYMDIKHWNKFYGNVVWGNGLSLCSSGYRPVANSCESGKERSDSIESGTLRDLLSNC